MSAIDKNSAGAHLLDIDRVERLESYLRGLKNPDNDGATLFCGYQADLEQVTPHEVMELFNRQLGNGLTADQILEFLDKAINAVSRGLRRYPRAKPEPLSFLALLVAENEALAARLNGIRQLLLKHDLRDLVPVLIDAVHELQAVDNHYLKKENILFPLLEKKHPRFAGLAVMWALHDKARQVLKKTLADFAAPDLADTTIRTDLGLLFFTLHGLVNKENLILFPIAADIFTDDEFSLMLAQCRDYKAAFLTPEAYAEFMASGAETEVETWASGSHLWLKTPTGNLTAEQAMQIFNVLPVDLSFVDADNKVQYFTRPKDRFFPRSPAVIGRDVERCHPPASVHIVEQIIEAFRAGQRDQARFWINLRGRKIMIEYFAVRDSQGAYMGVLEVSQDITEIQELTGEQRLLDWN